MTTNAIPLQGMRHYSSSSKVVVGNGVGIPISHIGDLSLSHNGLSLNQVLVVPTIIKNLLSVSQFSTDNNCYFIFNASGFVVKDQTTGRICLKALVEMVFIQFHWHLPKNWW